MINMSDIFVLYEHDEDDADADADPSEVVAMSATMVVNRTVILAF